MPAGDILYLPDDVGPVALISGRCYRRVRVVDEEPTTAPVTYVYDTCAECPSIGHIYIPCGTSPSSSSGCAPGWYLVDFHVCTDGLCLDCQPTVFQGCVYLECGVPGCYEVLGTWISVTAVHSGPYSSEQSCVSPSSSSANVGSSSSTSSTSSTSTSSTSSSSGGGGIYLNRYYCVEQHIWEEPCDCPPAGEMTLSRCIVLSGWDIVYTYGGLGTCKDIAGFGCVVSSICADNNGQGWATEQECETDGCPDLFCTQALYVGCP